MFSKKDRVLINCAILYMNVLFKETLVEKQEKVLDEYLNQIREITNFEIYREIYEYFMRKQNEIKEDPKNHHVFFDRFDTILKN